MFGDAIPHPSNFEALPVVDSGYISPPCAVFGCGKTPTTNHHWFPVSIARAAGYNGDDWPQNFLCEEHHMIWHGLVTRGLWSNADKFMKEKVR